MYFYKVTIELQDGDEIYMILTAADKYTEDEIQKKVLEISKDDYAFEPEMARFEIEIVEIKDELVLQSSMYVIADVQSTGAYDGDYYTGL